MMATANREPLYERLRKGLGEGIAHAKGELKLKTIELPEAPPEIDAGTLVALREAAAMSQSVFAKILYVSTKTVQSWEQGVRVPSLSTRRLIQIFAAQPEMVCRTVGVEPVHFGNFKIATDKRGRKRIVKIAPSRAQQ